MAANFLQIKDKVQRILTERYNGVIVDDQGRWQFRHESAQIFVRAWEWGDERVVINLTSPLLFKVKETPELFKYLALHADDYIFGHLAAVESDEGIMVMFTHSLLGDYLDAEELDAAVVGVLGTANTLDNELQAMFGGELFHDD